MRHKALKGHLFFPRLRQAGIILIFSGLALAASSLLAQETSKKQSTAPVDQVEYAEISHPVLSGHCQYLLQQRQQKIEFRNRIGALIFRNQSLKERLAPQQHTIRHNLEVNRRSLDREYYLALLKIQKMTEDILRRGCPGIEIQ